MVARRLLGITDAESEIIFHANISWTGEDLRAFAKGEKICEPEPVDEN